MRPPGGCVKIPSQVCAGTGRILTASRPKEERVPTKFSESQAGGMVESKEHTVQEAVKEVTDRVNAALRMNTKFVTVTGEDGKQYSVEAELIHDIREA
jgi:hypothetical protein